MKSTLNSFQGAINPLLNKRFKIRFKSIFGVYSSAKDSRKVLKTRYFSYLAFWSAAPPPSPPATLLDIKKQNI